MRGSRKASVLPLPVGAEAKTWCPLSNKGIACIWMGVGCLYPSDSSRAKSHAGRPRGDSPKTLRSCEASAAPWDVSVSGHSSSAKVRKGAGGDSRPFTEIECFCLLCSGVGGTSSTAEPFFVLCLASKTSCCSSCTWFCRRCSSGEASDSRHLCREAPRVSRAKILFLLISFFKGSTYE